jgi:hypothetical protein
MGMRLVTVEGLRLDDRVLVDVGMDISSDIEFYEGHYL